MCAAGFEPAPLARPVPETGALDRSATHTIYILFYVEEIEFFI
jgi:hypothetical protein